MKTEICLVICFLVGVLVFYLLKQSCGCAVVEGGGYLAAIAQELVASQGGNTDPGDPGCCTTGTS